MKIVRQIISMVRNNHQKGSTLSRSVGVFSAVAGILVAGLSLAACDDSDSSTSTGASGNVSTDGETLNVLTWETYHDQPWLDEFEKKTDITVNATNVGSVGEAIAKVNANPGQYDIVLTTGGSLGKYVDNDLLEPIDTSKIPNMKNIQLDFPWEDAVTVDGTLYGVLYTWGTIPLAYLPEEVAGLDLTEYENSDGELDDWNVLWDPALEGKVTLIDDAVTIMPTIALALGFDDPWNMDEQELGQFKEKLFALRPQVNALASGDNAEAAAFASGEAYAGLVGGPYVAAGLKPDGVDLEINNTVEQGVTAWTDNYSITKEGGASTPSKLAAAYEFINYTLSVPWQARLVAEEGQSGILDYDQATSKEAAATGLTKADLDQTLIPDTRAGDDFYSKIVFFQEYPDVQQMLDIWNEFKSGIGT